MRAAATIAPGAERWRRRSRASSASRARGWRACRRRPRCRSNRRRGRRASVLASARRPRRRASRAASAERDLVDARARDGAGDGDERGAGLVARCRARGTSPAPRRAISARWASVSTFWTSVGAPPTPRSNGRGGLRSASPRRRSAKLTSAVSSPATKPSGTAHERRMFAVEPAPPLAADRLRARAARRVRAWRDRDDRLARADRGGGQHGAVEHEVRRVAQEHACPCRSRARPRRRSRPRPAGRAGLGDRAQLRAPSGSRRRRGRAARSLRRRRSAIARSSARERAVEDEVLLERDRRVRSEATAR